jgi:Ca2+-binding EF-hand superfamily protein
VTLAEYQARSRDRILQADADHDGRVSLAEWTAYQTERREGSNGEGRGGDGGRWGGRGFGGDPARQFQMMDANHDGYVTPTEIDAASAERFARMDANHDGMLTPDERRPMRGGGEPEQPPPQ